MLTLYNLGGEQRKIHEIDYSEWWLRNGWSLEPLPLPSPVEVAKTLEELIQINFATLQEMDQLPGVTPTIAKKVISGRPFADLASLRAAVKSPAWDSLGERLGFDLPPSHEPGTDLHPSPE